MSVDEELPPSKLGTKEYWDKVYEREVGVFEDTGDEGEVWFGERAMEKMRDWVYANCPPEQKEQVGSESRKRRIRAMECGCGESSPDAQLTAFLLLNHGRKRNAPLVALDTSTK
jgi:hypothetical protein